MQVCAPTLSSQCVKVLCETLTRRDGEVVVSCSRGLIGVSESDASSGSLSAPRARWPFSGRRCSRVSPSNSASGSGDASGGPEAFVVDLATSRRFGLGFLTSGPTSSLFQPVTSPPPSAAEEAEAAPIMRPEWDRARSMAVEDAPLRRWVRKSSLE